MKRTLKDGIPVQNRADKINRNSGGEGAVSMTGLLEKQKSIPVCSLQKGLMRRKPAVLRDCEGRESHGPMRLKWNPLTAASKGLIGEQKVQKDVLQPVEREE